MLAPAIQVPSYKLLNQYFLNYVNSFGRVDERTRAHFDLKIRHTYDVVNNIQKIARLEGLNEQTISLARIIALFHDIGRFRQFVEYGTFDDSISLNHAELSVKLLQDEGVDILIPEPELNVIVKSILQHNIPFITETGDKDIILHSKLLRDADKMDIWKIQTETDIVFTIRSFEKTDHYEIPDALYESFLHKRIIKTEYAVSLNDFRLLRLSWIYDMNFPATFDLLSKRKYASEIIAKIPPSDRLAAITKLINNFMQISAQR